MTETKVCRSCKQDKPVTEFYTKRILASGKMLYRPDCRECACAKIAADPYQREMVRQRAEDWRAADLEHARQSCRESHDRHRDERNAEARKRRSDPETRPRILAQEAASRAHHAAQRRADAKAHRASKAEYYREYLRRYWKEHPDKAREYHARRRAAKRNAGGDHTAEDIAEIRRMQRDRCANPTCRCKLNGKGAEDHIVALAKGGTNDRRNLQLLCKSCNSKKRSKDAIDFMQEQGLLL
jgi:hypothetical protein